jgi:23S rRNA (guanosine2251-2'-O)-methyltransferase
VRAREQGRAAAAPAIIAAVESDPVVGFHPVREALRAGRRRLVRLHVREGLRRPELAELRKLAREAGVPVVETSADALNRLAPGARTQGLVLEAGPVPDVPLEELFERGEKGRRRLVALDGVEDPQNVGALLRAAEGAGATGGIVTDRHAPPLGGVVGRASAGALEHLPIARVVNLARALEAAKQAGFWVVALDPESPESLFESADSVWQGDLAIVVGAEGAGLRHGIRRLADHRFAIPMQGRVGSLNVAGAGALALFEAARRSRPAPHPRGSGGSAGESAC